jgi:hypothetical protein
MTNSELVKLIKAGQVASANDEAGAFVHIPELEYDFDGDPRAENTPLVPLELDEPDWKAWKLPDDEDNFYIEVADKKYILYIYEFQEWVRRKELVWFLGSEHEAEFNTKDGTIKRYRTR